MNGAVRDEVAAPTVPRSTIITLTVFMLASVALGWIVGDDLPELHLILDTAMFVLSAMLALLFLEVGRRLERPFYQHLSIAFAAVAALEFLHALVSVNWSGSLGAIAGMSEDLRPLTWPPPAYLLALGTGAALLVQARGARGAPRFALGVVAAALVLFLIFQRTAPFSPPDALGISRPSLVPVPILWGVIAWACWRQRHADRIIPTLGLFAITLLASNLFILYSRYPPDTMAIIAHLGRVGAYLALLFSITHMASLDMFARVRAEADLVSLNQALDARVKEQTALLVEANQQLEGEIAARRKSHDLLNAITESTPAVIYVKDLDGRYIMVNRRFGEIFGLEQGEVIGRTDHDLFAKEAADAFRAMDERVARADAALTEEEHAPHADGMHAYVSVKAPLRDESGAPYAVFGISTDITDVKRAEAALAESEERARLIVESALDAVIAMDADGIILDWSPQAVATFGWERGEAIGRTLGELIVPTAHRARHQTGLARFRETGEARVLNRRIEITALHRDGPEFPVELSITPIYAGGAITFSAFVRDISERQAARKRLEAQLERLALLDEVTQAIGERQDIGSIFQVAVRSVEEQLPADFVCLCLYDRPDNVLVVTGVGVKSAPLAVTLAMSEQGRIEVDQNGLSRCLSGHLVYEPDTSASRFPFPRRLARGGLLSFVAAPLQVESHVFGALIVARTRRDGFVSGECEFLAQLSKHIGLAANQTQLHTALQQAYDDLKRTQDAVMQQERLRVLGQMASGIAHDINNALSPIALYTESILETDAGLSAPTRAKLEIVHRAVEDAAHTIGRMKDFYRKREPQLALSPVSIDTLFDQVCELTQSRWKDTPQQRGVEIKIERDVQASLPAVLGVASELREALVNLVFNAVDALPAGGVITLRGAQLQDGQLVRIEVADNGVGMDEATRQRCLEPFFTTKGEAGSGLGLAMVYGVVQRHGGEFEIVSAPGEGASMRLTFAAASAQLANEPEVAFLPAPRLRILLIDDDPILLRSLRDVLGQDGHMLETAGDGGAGLRTFAAALEGDLPFDVVITDLGMPKMDGRQVAAAIKLIAPNTPVLLLTGWGERLMVEEERPPHIEVVLAKPPRLQALRAALAACKPVVGEG